MGNKEMGTGSIYEKIQRRVKGEKNGRESRFLIESGSTYVPFREAVWKWKEMELTPKGTYLCPCQ